MKILLVEDDPHLGQALHETLGIHQHVSTWVRDAASARRFLLAETFDLALLDIVLPGESGLTLLKWLRESGQTLAVIMLTARDTVTDRVIGLDTGADDYLPKPFAVEELLSRIRAVSRRRGEQRAALWHVGGLTIDTARRRVDIAGIPTQLSPREYALLLILAARPGAVITRAELARGSASEDPLEGNAVDVQIHGLRRKLGADRIGTVRGVGYYLEEKSP